MNVVQKLIMVAAGVVLCVVLGAIAGYNYANSGKSEAVIESLEIDAESVAEVKEIIKIREKKVTVYVDRIKTVVDKTGCADVPVDPDIDDSLFEAYRLTAGPEAHRTVPIRTLPEPGNTENTVN